MLDTGVSARRNGGSMVVWGGQWLQQMSHIMNVLKKWFEKMVISNRKTVLLNWESLKKEWDTLSIFLDSKKIVPGGDQKIARWDESWKSQSSKGTSGSFWRERCEIYMANSDRWWNLGPSLWSWEQKSLWYTATKNHQHQRNSKPLLEKPCWLYSGTLNVFCSLTSWKWC